MTVAILQVWFENEGQWLIVGVFADKPKADAEASIRGYPRWAVSEWGVRE